MKNVIKHKIPSNREAWLQDRLKGIGGSDAGAILGLNPYKSPYALWCEKTGRIHKDVDNEAMRLGRDLEDYVAHRFMEKTGKKVKKSSYSFQSKEHPFMLANVDRLVIGEDAGLECKTTNMLTRTKYDRGDIPASYYAQCMHYMAVTGMSKWYIAVLVMNKGFYWYEIQRDEKEIQAIIEEEKEFWECVENDIEPAIDGLNSTTEALEDQYPGIQDQTIDVFGRQTELECYLKINERIKELNEEKKKYENIFKHDLGDAVIGYMDHYQISWKPQTQQRLDTKRLQEEMPEIYAYYLKETTFRKFNIKEMK